MRRFAMPIVLLMLLAACSDDDGGRVTFPPVPTTASPTTPTTGQAASSTITAVPSEIDDWTFLVYLMADTDLEPFALEDLIEMASVGSTDTVNIIVLADRHPAFSDDAVLNLPDWEDSRMLRVGPGELTELAAPGELNLGDPQTLANFIAEGLTSFPAERYAVVLWDHGAGWPGMGPDESNGLDILDLADLRQGLSEGLARAGVPRIDLIGFDACLMATYEVASAVAPYADYMLSSQELEPGHGWNYQSLAAITLNPDADPVELGSALVDGYATQANASGTSEDITLSLIDLGLVDELQAALAVLTAPIITAPVDIARTLAGARTQVLSFGRNPDPDLDSNQIDLGGLLDLLAVNRPELAADAGAARSVLGQMILASTAGRTTAEASGLSIYFPEYERDFRQGYLFLEGVPHWPDALAAFYQAGAAIPADQQPEFIEIEGEEAIYFFDQDGFNIGAYFDLAAQDNVVEASILYAVYDETEDTLYYVGEEPAAIADDGSGLVAGIYDLTVFTISDGIDTALAFFGLTIDLDSGLAFVDVPLAYQGPNDLEPQDVLLSLVIDPTDGTVLEEGFFAVDPSGTYGELYADPNGLIYPVVLAEYPDGSTDWVISIDVGLWADLPLLQYDLVPLDPGTGIYLELSVFDYGGNFDSVAVFDYIP